MGGMMPGMGGGNNPMQMIQKFMEFKNNFKDTPLCPDDVFDWGFLEVIRDMFVPKT